MTLPVDEPDAYKNSVMSPVTVVGVIETVCDRDSYTSFEDT